MVRPPTGAVDSWRVGGDESPTRTDGNSVARNKSRGGREGGRERSRVKIAHEREVQ